MAQAPTKDVTRPRHAVDLDAMIAFATSEGVVLKVQDVPIGDDSMWLAYTSRAT